MLNEGRISNDPKALIKSEMVRQIQRLGPTNPDSLERAVFKAITGHDRKDVDWSVEDNQAGYFTWLKSFDQLIDELIDDGYITVEQTKGSDECRLVASPADPPVEYSQVVHPSRNSTS